VFDRFTVVDLILRFIVLLLLIEMVNDNNISFAITRLTAVTIWSAVRPRVLVLSAD